MIENYSCGDHGALVSYIYDECTPAERRAIAAHAAICRACAEELRSLGATREQLAAWTPPDAQLGFRIVSDAPPSNVLRPHVAQWWRKPMPAWAQAAAAAVIFTTGITLGALRGTTAPPSQPAPVAAMATAAADSDGVTRADLVSLEQRLRADLSARVSPTTVATSPAATSTDANVLEQVRTMIDESEQRQRRELALRTAEMVRDFDAQRGDDLVRIERALGQMDGTTGAEVAQQRQMLNYLMRVSQRGQ